MPEKLTNIFYYGPTLSFVLEMHTVIGATDIDLLTKVFESQYENVDIFVDENPFRGNSMEMSTMGQVILASYIQLLSITDSFGCHTLIFFIL